MKLSKHSSGPVLNEQGVILNSRNILYERFTWAMEFMDPNNMITTNSILITPLQLGRKYRIKKYGQM